MKKNINLEIINFHISNNLYETLYNTYNNFYTKINIVISDLLGGLYFNSLEDFDFFIDSCKMNCNICNSDIEILKNFKKELIKNNILNKEFLLKIK